MDSWKKVIPTEFQIEAFKEVEQQMNLRAEKEGFFKLSVPFAVTDCKKNN